MNQEQINDLIHKYESELIKVKYQEDKLNDIIVELRIMKKNAKNNGYHDLEKQNILLDNSEEDEIRITTNNKNNIPLKIEEPDIIENLENNPDWNLTNDKEDKEEFFRKRTEQVSEEVNRNRGDDRQITQPIKRDLGRPKKPGSFNLSLDDDEFEENSDDMDFVDDNINDKQGGYQLSDWDKFLLNILNSEQVMLSTSDLFDVARIYTDQKTLGFTDDQIKGKIARSLTKLTKRPDGILRYNSSKKGYVYGMANWFKKGEPKQQYSI